ncbi:MAG: alpha/beta fold hydrolase [Nitriliruptorales bacterium]|nr:alpha/beta fold hydrolase [Nitriliruptorales bacterium]
MRTTPSSASTSGSDLVSPLAELVEVTGVDPPLDGLWYPSSARQERGPVVLCHGNTMNFYTGPPRFLPPALVAAGFGSLALNRRGHDILSTRDSRAPVGGAFQTAAEGLADTAAAVGYAADRTGRTPILVGHSNGGMLAAAHAAAHPVGALILMSAHLGGPEIVRLSCEAGQLAAGRLEETIDIARRLVADGRGDELLLLPGWWYAISADSLLDRLEHTPSLLRSAETIGCPVLFVVGAGEDPAVYPAHTFAERTSGRSDVVVVPECDHFYRGREDQVATIVADWLTEHAPIGT